MITSHFDLIFEMLDLQEYVEEIYVCRGQIEAPHPIFIPPDLLLAEKLIFQTHRTPCMESDNMADGRE